MPIDKRLLDIKGIGEKRAKDIVIVLEQSKQSLDEFLKMSGDELKTRFKLPKNIVQAILDIATSTPKIDDLLTDKGIKILKKDSSDYPKQLIKVLGERTPEQLYVWGNLDLLKKPSVGFCGSRNVTEKGIEVTIDIAKQIAELGWVVISGHARGVDIAAHRTALENGASTIIVVAEGISSFRLRQELKQIAKPEQILIVSEFPPEAEIGRAHV